MTWTLTGGDKKKFPKFGFIFTRFFRIAPQFYLFILFTLILPLLYSGPQWDETVGSVVRKCYKNWWLSVLFLQNYFNVDEMVIYRCKMI